jgi:hypothetical protein
MNKGKWTYKPSDNSHPSEKQTTTHPSLHPPNFKLIPTQAPNRHHVLRLRKERTYAIGTPPASQHSHHQNLTHLAQSNDDWSWRYVIAAPTQEIFQDWFRTVKSKVADGVLEQVSPEFIVFNREKLHLGASTREKAEAPQFMNKLIFNLMNDNEGRNITTFQNGHYSQGEYNSLNPRPLD